MEADKREWVSGTKNIKGKGLRVSNKARKQKMMLMGCWAQERMGQGMTRGH